MLEWVGVFWCTDSLGVVHDPRKATCLSSEAQRTGWSAWRERGCIEAERERNGRDTAGSSKTAGRLVEELAVVCLAHMPFLSGIIIIIVA